MSLAPVSGQAAQTPHLSALREPSIGATRDSQRLSVYDIDSIIRHLDTEAVSSADAETCRDGSQTIAELARALDHEKTCALDTEAAAAILRGLAKGEKPASLIDRWRAIPSANAAGHGGIGGIGQAIKSMLSEIPEALASGFLPSSMGPLLTVIQSEIGDIAHDVTCGGWTPVLDPAIAGAPCFASVRRRYEETLIGLKHATQLVADTREQVLAAVRDGKEDCAARLAQYQAATETLAAHIEAAAGNRHDYARAAGKARHAFAANMYSASAKAATIGLAMTPAKVLWPLLEASQIVAGVADRQRGHRVVDELNMCFADVLFDSARDLPPGQIDAGHIDPEKLRRLLKGPVKARVDLVIEALENEAGSDGDVPKLARGDLWSISPGSRAGILLRDNKALFMALARARLSPSSLADKLGKAYCRKLLNTPAQSLGAKHLAPLAHGIVSGSVGAASSMTVSATMTAARIGGPALETANGWIKRGAGYANRLVASTAGGLQQAWNGLSAGTSDRAAASLLTQARASLDDGLLAAAAAELFGATGNAATAGKSVHAFMQAAAGLHAHSLPAMEQALRDGMPVCDACRGADAAQIGEMENRPDTQMLLVRHNTSHLIFWKDPQRGWLNLSDRGQDGKPLAASPSQIMKAIPGEPVDAIAIMLPAKI